MPEDFSIDQADLGLEIEGTALLLWNMKEGHFHHFEAAADTSVNFELSATGQGEAADAVISLSGDLEIAASTETR